MNQLTYFKLEEFACKCGQCGSVALEMDTDFMLLLDDIRAETKIPMMITSGYRCKRHPIEAAKSAPGPHNTGLAADIAVWGTEAMVIVKAAMTRNVQGIGLKQHGDISQRFVHLDICDPRPNGPRPHIWTYS